MKHDAVSSFEVGIDRQDINAICRNTMRMFVGATGLALPSYVFA
jgi:hypothetical protein